VPGPGPHHEIEITHPGTFWYHPHVSVAEQVARGLYDVEPEVWRTGRQGTLILVNGAPAGEDLVLYATSRERWRIPDAAHSRFFALGLDGHLMHIVAGDAGPSRTTSTTDALTLAPGDRFEVVVEPAPGSRSVLWSLPVDRGFGVDPGEPFPLLTVVGPDAAADLPALPARRAGMPRVAIWTVHNTTDGIQPFHLHGLFFDGLDAAGIPPAFDSREDVANVPAGGVLRIAVPFEVPGPWMFHTHLLDHASHGMMAVIDVE